MSATTTNTTLAEIRDALAPGGVRRAAWAATALLTGSASELSSKPWIVIWGANV
jgi:hypothetical protein